MTTKEREAVLVYIGRAAYSYQYRGMRVAADPDNLDLLDDFHRSEQELLTLRQLANTLRIGKAAVEQRMADNRSLAVKFYRQAYPQEA